MPRERWKWKKARSPKISRPDAPPLQTLPLHLFSRRPHQIPSRRRQPPLSPAVLHGLRQTPAAATPILRHPLTWHRPTKFPRRPSTGSQPFIFPQIEHDATRSSKGQPKEKEEKSRAREEKRPPPSPPLLLCSSSSRRPTDWWPRGTGRGPPPPPRSPHLPAPGNQLLVPFSLPCRSPWSWSDPLQVGVGFAVAAATWG